ncbi:MAG: monovalent cation/H+ antiporter complex subunit F [Propionibacteriaceae bacterium]|nr:monovalent cation/H+ antiporter complex subunit F [Propionibacteriaceae bacterium]
MTEFVREITPWIAGIVATLLFVDIMLTIIKIVRGPSVLNRALAADLLVSSLICAIGAEMVISRHSWSLPILVTLAMVAFVGTVAVARFVARDSDDDGAGAALERKRRQEFAKRAPKDVRDWYSDGRRDKS